jgi:hypothetical protein
MGASVLFAVLVLCAACLFERFINLIVKHKAAPSDAIAYTFCCFAGFLDWGWQAGCDFVGKTCTAYAAAHPGQQYFCTKEQYSSDNVNTVCTFDGLARAACAEAPFAEGCAMKVKGAGFDATVW